eukprot:CAMPEP_0170096596 /NCGR_PEP_ID=MMETSP0019_2-20121128/28693_1 /TAXON_ID=98059 /ORGANISM="Dinobryon sp., Strain UTEXLB2267" /LENGTH=60 /DNA_ID=CAMNT_0010318643 /DNA_START=382 /DNA_END=564 /DNA_ORIENTATION=-
MAGIWCLDLAASSPCCIPASKWLSTNRSVSGIAQSDFSEVGVNMIGLATLNKLMDTNRGT